MEYTLIELLKFATPIFAIGGAWGGAKVALNGTRERVKTLETRSDASEKELHAIGRSVTRVETKQDMLIQYMREDRK